MNRDILKGAAQAFDLGAVLSRNDSQIALDDLTALKSDWEQVGKDLQHALSGTQRQKKETEDLF
jgi:hypothetical protein